MLVNTKELSIGARSKLTLRSSVPGYGKYISQKDSKFEVNYSGAKAAGIPLGAYWYSYAKSTSEAVEEAKVFLEVVKGKQFEYPLYFDIEDKSQKNLSKSTLTAICEAFCTTLEKAGYFTGVYANTDWLTNRLDHAKLSSKYTIWLADYRDLYNKTLKRDMHQYTSSGALKGISGKVDMNHCTRDFPTIIKNAGLNGYTKEKCRDITIRQVKESDMKCFVDLADTKGLKYSIE